MSVTRRRFLTDGLAATAAAGLGLAACGDAPRWGERLGRGRDDWERIRARFPLDRDYIHLAGLLLTSHPEPIREAVLAHRRGLDDNPALYLEQHNSRLTAEVRQAAARYLDARPEEIALTDSTTVGLGLVYNGVSLRPDQELLTTEDDYYATHESLRYRSRRSGAALRKIPLYRDIHAVSGDEVVDRLMAAITPRTRVLAVTWVHSKTGLKIPIRRIADRLAEVNAERDPADRALLCVDAVHGLGVEKETVGELGCDVYIAGCHKWLFGPRGTGIVWGSPAARDAVAPTIPTFTRGAGWGGAMSPGGFQSFEHRWALAQAFEFHREIGRERVTERIHQLNRDFKEGLRAMPHVKLYTPLDEGVSAGIVCFDVHGMNPRAVVDRLAADRIIASTTPYTPSHARVAPGLLNDEREVETALAAIRKLGR